MPRSQKIKLRPCLWVDASHFYCVSCVDAQISRLDLLTSEQEMCASTRMKPNRQESGVMSCTGHNGLGHPKGNEGDQKNALTGLSLVCASLALPVSRTAHQRQNNSLMHAQSPKCNSAIHASIDLEYNMIRTC